MAGVGLALFQPVIPRPGLATGIYTNTRRVGVIVSGPLIALGSIVTFGYRNVFAGCAVLVTAALPLIIVGRTSWSSRNFGSVPDHSRRTSSGLLSGR